MGYGNEAHQAITGQQTSAEAKSEAMGLTTIGGSFLEGERNLDLRPDGWGPTGKTPPEYVENQRWLAEQLPLARALAKALPIRSVFSAIADVVNDFLEKEGFSIKLDPLGPDEYGMAAVLKLVLEWVHTGKRTIVDTRYGRMVGVSLPVPTVAHTVSGHDHPVVTVEAVGWMKIILTQAGDKKDLKGPDLFRVAQALNKGLAGAEPFECVGVRFPRTELDIEPSLEWVIGMGTTTKDGRGCLVTQAKQQVRLVLDEKGAIIEEATAMAMALESCGSRPEPVVIRDTFLAILVVPLDGVDEVALPFVVQPSAWKKVDEGQAEELPAPGGMSFAQNPGMCVPPSLRGRPHGSSSNPGAHNDE